MPATEEACAQAVHNVRQILMATTEQGHGTVAQQSSGCRFKNRWYRSSRKPTTFTIVLLLAGRRDCSWRAPTNLARTCAAPPSRAEMHDRRATKVFDCPEILRSLSVQPS